MLLRSGSLALLSPFVFLAAPPPAAAVFASPIHGGCYIAGPNDCRIHVDPLVVNVASGQRLQAIRIQVNFQTVYDFRTDVSNPPIGNYAPTIPAQDFGVRCGQTYTINVLGRDSGDSNFLNMGQTAQVTCPAAVP